MVSLEELIEHHQSAISDCEADFPDVCDDDIAHDMAISTLASYLPETTPEVRGEFMRCVLGWIPGQDDDLRKPFL